MPPALVRLRRRRHRVRRTTRRRRSSCSRRRASRCRCRSTSGTRPTSRGRTCRTRSGTSRRSRRASSKSGFKVDAEERAVEPGLPRPRRRGQCRASDLLGWTGDFGDPDNFVGTFFQAPSSQWGFDEPGDLRHARRGRDGDGRGQADRALPGGEPARSWTSCRACRTCTRSRRSRSSERQGLRAEPGLARAVLDRLDRIVSRADRTAGGRLDAASSSSAGCCSWSRSCSGSRSSSSSGSGRCPAGRRRRCSASGRRRRRSRRSSAQYGLDKPVYVQYWSYSRRRRRATSAPASTTRPAGHRRAQAALPGDHRARARGDALRDRARHPARLHRGEALRDARSTTRSLVVSLLGISIPVFFLGDPAQVRLRGEARAGCRRVGRDRRRSIDLEHPTNFYILDALLDGRPGRVLGRAAST